MAAIARDIGLSAQELEFIASKGPNAAAELPKLLRALGVDPQKLPSDRRTTKRDLQRICITCGHKARCRHDSRPAQLRSTTAIFCPNAMSIDELSDLAQSH